MPVVNLFDIEPTHACVRGGQGLCLEITAFQPEEFASPLQAVGMTVVPPGASIGSHADEDRDGILLVMDGQGMAEIDGEKRRVKKGDVVYSRPGAEHALMNDQPEDLVLFAFSVAIE